MDKIKEEQIEQITKTFNELKMVIECVDSENIDTINHSSITFKPSSYEQFKCILERIQRVASSIPLSGYALYGSKLMVWYSTDCGVELTFYLTDVETSLEKLSSGKCKVTVVNTPSKEVPESSYKTISCNL